MLVSGRITNHHKKKHCCFFPSFVEKADQLAIGIFQFSQLSTDLPDNDHNTTSTTWLAGRRLGVSAFRRRLGRISHGSFHLVVCFNPPLAKAEQEDVRDIYSKKLLEGHSQKFTYLFVESWLIFELQPKADVWWLIWSGLMPMHMLSFCGLKLQGFLTTHIPSTHSFQKHQHTPDTLWYTNMQWIITMFNKKMHL